MKNLHKVSSAVLLTSFFAVSSAQAAVDPAVTTAMADGLTDVGTVGAAGLIIVIAIAVYRYMKRSA